MRSCTKLWKDFESNSSYDENETRQEGGQKYEHL